jgi:hypothetical protein
MRVPISSRLLHGGGLLLAGGIAAVSIGTGPAHATGSSSPVTFEYDFCKDGICPSGSDPWLRATIEDTTPQFGIPGVTIKLNSLLKSANESFLGSTPSSPPSPNLAIAFNFTDPIPQNIGGSCSGTGCRQGPPQFEAPAPGNTINFPAGSPFTGFDLALFLNLPPAAFGGTQEATFTLFAQGLTASKFNTANASGYCTAAQVDGVSGTGGSTTSTIIANFCGDPVPSKVPAPLPILGASMAFGFSRQLRRRVRRSGDSPRPAID